MNGSSDDKECPRTQSSCLPDSSEIEESSDEIEPDIVFSLSRKKSTSHMIPDLSILLTIADLVVVQVLKKTEVDSMARGQNP